MGNFIVSVAAAILVFAGMASAAAAIFAGGVFVGFTYINSMCSKEFSVVSRFDKPSYTCEPYAEDVPVEDTGVREIVTTPNGKTRTTTTFADGTKTVVESDGTITEYRNEN